MFKKLKRKIILINSITSAIIITVAFSIIYMIATQNNHRDINFDFLEKPTFSPQSNSQSSIQSSQSNPFSNYDDEDMRELFEQRISIDRNENLSSLLISLFATGVLMELMVVLVSFYLAEQSVRPVREAYESQKAFISNASHEIKTPLAVIQANLEAADITDNQWINNAMLKTEELTVLNNSLLSLTRTESIKETNKPELVDLTKITKETANCYIPQIKDKGIKLKITTSLTDKISINKNDYIQLLNILIDNAIKYGDKKINIKLSPESVSVENDGTTIKPEDLEHIFERFYQTDKNSTGVGLGLSIGKALANNNNWKLTANSDDKTTTFKIDF